MSKPIGKLDRLVEFHRLLSLETDDCVIWPYAKTSKGYGVVRHLGRQRQTHRLALVLTTGTDAPQLQAAHGPCHNPACMNVRHLRWATPSENLADRDRDGTAQRGVNSPAARLTEDEVRAIILSSDTHAALAKRFSISKGQVYNVKSGRHWPHIWAELNGAGS
jgi:hypothetical protein